MIKQALLSGAQGYILKSGEFEDLREALVATSGERVFVPPQTSSQTEIPLNYYDIANAEEPNDPLSPLSPREREIFHLLAIGLQNSGIAKKLFISPRTVETHRARIIQKLSCVQMAS